MINPEQRARQYEGPPELFHGLEGVHEYEINSRKDMPDGKSVADNLTDQYGERGVGWDTDTTRYDEENQIKDELHAPEFNLAQEGLRNAMAIQKYESNEGVNLEERKIRTFVRESDKVDVVIYPDGKMHKAAQK
jgi:hypothetical protein